MSDEYTGWATDRPNSGRVISLWRANSPEGGPEGGLVQMTTQQLLIMREDIMRVCPCCAGSGAHAEHVGVLNIFDQEVLGIAMRPCNTCHATGQVPYMNAN